MERGEGMASMIPHTAEVVYEERTKRCQKYPASRPFPDYFLKPHLQKESHDPPESTYILNMGSSWPHDKFWVIAVTF
jgi:hypothetical protein